MKEARSYQKCLQCIASVCAMEANGHPSIGGSMKAFNALCRLPSGETNTVVATHTRNFLVYSGSRVIWLAKGPTVPVAVRVTEVGPLGAALVVLDDEGLLTVCYLGTSPPTSVLGLSEGREPDWDQVQARRKELARIIRDKSGGNKDALTVPTPQQEHLCIRSQVLTRGSGPTIRWGS